jgi:signal transduction histidine kinase
VSLRSTNPTAAHGVPVPGRGLSGIRHRAELLGGTFAAAVTGGEFDVQVRIPIGHGA